MNAYYFRKDKIAVLDAIKAQLPFSGGKYQLLFSWYEIPFPTIFYCLNFQLPHPNRSNSVSSQKRPIKRHKRIRESRKVHSKPFTYFFSLGAPEAFKKLESNAYYASFVLSQRPECLHNSIVHAKPFTIILLIFPQGVFFFRNVTYPIRLKSSQSS